MDSSAVGEFDGEESLVFGHLSHAAFLGPDSAGAVAFLDIGTGQLRLFSLGGTPLSVSGGIGEGPGELGAPASLGVGGTPDLAVVGDLTGRIHRFRLVGDSLVYVDQERVSRPFESHCTIGDTSYILAPGTPGDSATTPSIIYRADDGARPFGRAYHFPEPHVRYWYSQGHLACSSAGVFYASMRLGEVHAFSPDGELLWIRPLPEFETVPSFMTEGGFGYDQNTRGILDMVLSLATVGDSLVVAQVARTDYGVRPTDPPTTRVYALRSTDGSMAGLSVDGPQVLGGSNHNVVVYSSDPFPRFQVHEVEGGE
jgi:outer membrane protein assembly factor BamB